MFHRSSVLIETTDRQMELNWHELKDTSFSQFFPPSFLFFSVKLWKRTSTIVGYVVSLKTKTSVKNCVHHDTDKINTKDSFVID